ncbi:MAG TPA: hypothetical protein VN948_01965 [Terriglobales bacterium]|nr:hypothetical protein [Terriglobales bacterium]
MSYIVCGGCGDLVGGRIPSGDEPRVLTCVHCHAQTAFNDNELRQGLVGYDEATKRWRVATLADSSLAEGKCCGKKQANVVSD